MKHDYHDSLSDRLILIAIDYFHFTVTVYEWGGEIFSSRIAKTKHIVKHLKNITYQVAKQLPFLFNTEIYKDK